MNYKIYDTIICSGLTQNPIDGSIYFDDNTRTIWMASNNQWFKASVFNKKEYEREQQREKLLKSRKEKLNKLKCS